MNRRILIVATTEGFMIKGIETKLKGIGVDSVYCSPKLKEISVRSSGTDLILLFTDENTRYMAEALVFIKDHCSEKNKQVIVIGKKEEYKAIQEILPESLVFQFYERPLEMEQFLRDVESYLDEEAKEARKKSILIVDDDASYMGMITTWLKDTYRISTAGSGVEAITWLAKNHADLILLDYEMPIVSGSKVFEMLKSDASTANIPVMFLTGKGDKESVMQVLALKPVGYVLKNVDRKTLLADITGYFTSKI